MFAVEINGQSLQFASRRLKSNIDVVTKAVNQDPFSLEHASPEVRNEKEVVLYAYSGNKESLKFASTPLRNDKWISEYLSDINNKIVLEKCLQINGLMLS